MLSLSELPAQAIPARALVFVLRFGVFAEALWLSRDRAHDIPARRRRDWNLEATAVDPSRPTLLRHLIDPSGLLAPERQ